MRKAIYSFILAVLPAILIAQIRVPTWDFVGPTTFPVNNTGQINGIGRVTKIKFDPIVPNKLYATSASGGLWISINGGDTWTGTGTDKMPSHKEATICIDYTNTNTLYLGTGDPNYYYAGYGVWKSTDAGATWSQSNSGMGNKLVDELLMSPTNNNTLIAATDDGIYKSYNAGASWIRRFNRGQFTDMDFKSGSNGRVVFACTFDSLYRSDDAGETWSVVTNGFYIPGGAGGQGLRVAVTPADTNVVYLGMVANRGSLFKSTDGGHSFAIMKDSFALSLTGYDINDGGQGNYNFDINADPTDAHTIYWVSHNNWKSTMSGTASSWALLTHWYEIVHTDMHCLAFDPFAPGKLYNANDGAIWLTADGGNTWDQKSDGLDATEIAPAASSRLDKNTISIGTQDNGELYYNSSWITNRGGDWYEYMAYDYLNPQTVYYANGNRRVVSGGDQSLNMPIVSDFDRILFSPLNNDLSFAGNDTLLRTRNLTSQSPTWDIINIFGGAIMAMAFSPADSNKLFIITNDNMLNISSNALSPAPTFTSYPTPASTYNTAGIVVINSNPAILYMYNGGNIYTSADTGVTWTDVTYTYPSALDVVGMVHDPYTIDQSIFIANTTGVYFKRDTMHSWQDYSPSLPSVADIQGLDAYNDGSPNSVLRAQFYGRGMWQAPINTVRKEVAVNFGADHKSVCEGTTIHFSDSTYNSPTTWSWTFPGGSPSSSTSQNPSVTYNTPGTYTVSLTASNSMSTETKTRQEYITVYTIDSIPVSEGFEGAVFPPAGWTNYDGGNDSVVWSLSTYGGFGASAHSMFFDNYSYNETGKDKKMYFGADMTHYDSVVLSFDVAYQTLQGYSDSLEVLLSPDCGETFHRIYIRGGDDLATAPHLDSPEASFAPTDTQWRRDSVTLFAYSHLPGVIISFDNISGYGTDLYVDNINLHGKRTVVNGIQVLDERGSIIAYPNPTTGIVHIQYSNVASNNTTLSLYDSQGKKIKDIEAPANHSGGQLDIDLSNLSDGLYLIKSAGSKNMIKITLVK